MEQNVEDRNFFQFLVNPDNMPLAFYPVCIIVPLYNEERRVS